jgi:hypothetical protein
VSQEDRFAELTAELERVGERLGDLAMDLLRDALDVPGSEAADQAVARERLVNRARASLEKAARLLGEAASDGPARRRPGGAE